MGTKKAGDFSDGHVLKSYEILLDKCYPRERVVLSILPLKMRYAGPREAVFHALIRQNFGSSHFIVGRDHAGVGRFYEPFAAQRIFENFNKNEVGIKIMKYPEVVYDQARRKHCFADQCRPQDQIFFSGTDLRHQIKTLQRPPAHLIRPEVYDLLTKAKDSLFVDDRPRGYHNGFVLWLTGFSQAGKSTVGDRVYGILRRRGCRVERLDGDIVRESLTKNLGFSKEDREENIRRVSFVAELLSRQGVGVIASFISPYRRQRARLRDKIDNFIEVFVNAPLTVCERRDRKGNYVKARRGELKNFTGISDPYEKPARPDIELRTDQESLEQSAGKVVAYLEKEGFIDPL
jgi:sulfate adenylyltransferase